MTMDAPLVLPPDDRSSVRRCLLAAVAVALVHAGFVYWLSRRVVSPNAAGAPDSAIMIELPPMTVRPPAPAAEVPPGPEMKEAEPEPAPQPELQKVEPQAMAVPDLPPAPKPDAVLVAPPKPAPRMPPKPRVEAKPAVEPKPRPVPKRAVEPARKPVEKPTPKEAAKKEEGPRAPRTGAPPRQSAGTPGQRPAEASRGGASSAVSASAWQGLVSSQINRNTRYPPAANGASGAASVSFSIDRAGRLVAAGLSRSAGSPALDAEAVAIVRRASPFPPPPAELPGGRFNFTKTINFRHQ